MMLFRAVKQSPILNRVEKEMHRIGLGTFLGTDPRSLSEILNEDQDLIHSLNLTHEKVASRLERLTEAAKEDLGEVVSVEGRYEIRAEEHRGMIPCPWAHSGGLFVKNYVELRDMELKEVLVWSDLSIHLIKEHGFYQGRGSPFRLEPTTLMRVLWRLC
jgi:hypothetical protein